jgi:hypothetical protein
MMSSLISNFSLLFAFKGAQEGLRRFGFSISDLFAFFGRIELLIIN